MITSTNINRNAGLQTCKTTQPQVWKPVLRKLISRNTGLLSCDFKYIAENSIGILFCGMILNNLKIGQAVRVQPGLIFVNQSCRYRIQQHIFYYKIQLFFIPDQPVETFGLPECSLSF